MNTYYAIKQHMTQTWDSTGRRHSVTVLNAAPLKVTQLKSAAIDGYQAIQVGIGQTNKKLSKPLQGHLKTATPRYLKEIRLTNDADTTEFASHQILNIADYFSVGDIVNASGITKGKGFSGAMKRWGFAGGPRTHGQSDRARAVGSIGQGTSPGRVHKGKKMPGHYGVERFTIRNLTILHIDPTTNQVYLSGPLPGARGSVITLTKVGVNSKPIELINITTSTPEPIDSIDSNEPANPDTESTEA